MCVCVCVCVVCCVCAFVLDGGGLCSCVYVWWVGVGVSVVFVCAYFFCSCVSRLLAMSQVIVFVWLSDCLVISSFSPLCVGKCIATNQGLRSSSLVSFRYSFCFAFRSKRSKPASSSTSDQVQVLFTFQELNIVVFDFQMCN